MKSHVQRIQINSYETVSLRRFVILPVVVVPQHSMRQWWLQYGHTKGGMCSQPKDGWMGSYTWFSEEETG